MEKTIDELIAADTVVVPEYLVVNTEANEFRHITHGREVFHVVGHKVFNMANDENGKLVDNKVVVSVEDSRVDYIANENKQPYEGLINPVSVAFAEGTNKDRLLLQYFKEFVKGRFEFGAIVYAQDVIESAGDAKPTPEGVTVAPATDGATVEAK